MSDLDAKRQGVRFEPVSEPQYRPPGGWHIFLGVILPAATVFIELVSRLCAKDLFDPIPTWAHVAAVASVPAINLWVWSALQDPDAVRAIPAKKVRTLALASGFAVAISALYALLFLPILPLAIVAIIVGVGLLPLSPLTSFVSALKLLIRLRDTRPGVKTGRGVAAGLAAGIAVLVALDVPSGATRLGVQWAASSDPSQRSRGLALLRTIGDDDLLLRMCYEAAGRPAGLLSAFVMLSSSGLLEPEQRRIAQSPAEVREIYYRVHGIPFNAKPAPFAKSALAARDEWQWDTDHGGTQVGGRIKGLDIAASRIDGTIRADEATAYLEWIVEFHNTSLMDREARLQMLLPPGGVVSRATLWVNGEEREAAYGGRAEVRAAYTRVAVQQRRDPLLVTTKGADRVLAQAFPVPRNGGTIKFKIGITAPLELISDGKARLVLPAIVDRNFSFAADVKHQLWIESRQPLSIVERELTSTRVDPQLYRITGALADVDLARTRGAITIERGDAGPAMAAKLGDEDDVVMQRIVRQAPSPAGTMLILIDGSVRMREASTGIAAALEAIPEGAKVGLLIAGDQVAGLPVAPWTLSQKRAAQHLIRTARYVGGQDNTPTVAQALQALEGEADAHLLWIHGPQPIAFRASAGVLEQAASRLKRLPQVLLYATEPGPNELLPDQHWAWRARTLPRTGSVGDDLTAALSRELGTAPRLIATRTRGHAAEAAAKASDHVTRLWARDQVLDIMRTPAGDARKTAVELASAQRLVTPVSGAVVLETKQQYEEARLTPVAPGSVPAVPEPHEWALILLALTALAWMAHRNRHMLAAM